MTSPKTAQIMCRLTPEMAAAYRTLLASQGSSIQEDLELHVKERLTWPDPEPTHTAAPVPSPPSTQADLEALLAELEAMGVDSGT
jgi:hypothetical protein